MKKDKIKLTSKELKEKNLEYFDPSKFGVLSRHTNGGFIKSVLGINKTQKYGFSLIGEFLGALENPYKIDGLYINVSEKGHDKYKKEMHFQLFKYIKGGDIDILYDMKCIRTDKFLSQIYKHIALMTEHFYNPSIPLPKYLAPKGQKEFQNEINLYHENPPIPNTKKTLKSLEKQHKFEILFVDRNINEVCIIIENFEEEELAFTYIFNGDSWEFSNMLNHSNSGLHFYFPQKMKYEYMSTFLEGCDVIDED